MYRRVIISWLILILRVIGHRGYHRVIHSGRLLVENFFIKEGFMWWSGRRLRCLFLQNGFASCLLLDWPVLVINEVNHLV